MRLLNYFPVDRPPDLTRFYDGQIWLAEAGIDFTCATDIFMRRVIADCESRGLACRVQRAGEDVVIRATSSFAQHGSGLKVDQKQESALISRS
jgi:hypothetical protein